MADAPADGLRGARLIALAGLPGAGKSTLAKGLQAALRAEIVSRDAVRQSEFRAWNDRAAKRAAFELVRQEVATLLKAGATVVVDGATLATVAERRVLRALAASLGASYLLLWLDLPAEIAAARIADDMHNAPSDRTPALAHDVAQRFELPTNEEGFVRIDGEGSVAHVLQAALRAAGIDG